MDKNNFNKITMDENINSDKQFNDYVPHESVGKSLISSQPVKSAAIRKRLEKLQCYGEPSSLSPITINNSSKRVSSEFQSPLRSIKERHLSVNAKFVQIPR